MEQVAELACPVWGNLVPIYLFRRWNRNTPLESEGNSILASQRGKQTPRVSLSVRYHTGGRVAHRTAQGHLTNLLLYHSSTERRLITFKSTAHAQDKDGWALGDNLVEGGCENNYRNKRSLEHGDRIEREAT